MQNLNIHALFLRIWSSARRSLAAKALTGDRHINYENIVIPKNSHHLSFGIFRNNILHELIGHQLI
jgi:hypothetical protein